MTPTIDDIAKDVKKLSEAVIEHRVRLENGVRVFTEQKEKLAAVALAVVPKPMPVFKVVGLVLTIFMIITASIWAIADKLGDRPTAVQMEQQLKRVTSQNQDEVARLREDMAAQHALIEDVQASQGKIREHLRQTTEKLDQVLGGTYRRKRSR